MSSRTAARAEQGPLRIKADTRLSHVIHRAFCTNSSSLIPRGRSLLGVMKFPVRYRREFTREVAGWRAQLTSSEGQGGSNSSKFPVFFPVSRERPATRLVRS